MIKLLRRTKSKTTKDEKGKNVPRLEITEVVLVHCNIFNNSSQNNSRVLYIFVPNKSFGQLLHITNKTFIFSYIVFVYWSMVYWSKLLDIKDKINIDTF